MTDLSVFPDLDVNETKVEDLQAFAIKAGFSKNKVEDLKALAISAGHHSKKVGEALFKKYITAILSKKHLFKKCKNGHIYFRKTETCIPVKKVVSQIVMTRQNLNQTADGKIEEVKKDGEGNIRIMSFQNKGQQFFILVHREEEDQYYESIKDKKYKNLDDTMSNKIKKTIEMETLCVNLLGKDAVEISDMKIINSLSITVLLTEGKKEEYQLSSDDKIKYSRDLNMYFISEDESDQDAITAFIELGGEIRERKCSLGKPCDKNSAYCKLQTAEEGRCVKNQFEEKSLEEVTMEDGTIFRGTPEVMKQFKTILRGKAGASAVSGAVSGAASGAGAVIGRPPDMKEEEPKEDVERLKQAIRSCLEAGNVATYT